jgi:hypothetical protein
VLATHKIDLATQFWAKTETAITNNGYNESEQFLMSEFEFDQRKEKKIAGSIIVATFFINDNFKIEIRQEKCFQF